MALLGEGLGFGAVQSLGHHLGLFKVLGLGSFRVWDPSRFGIVQGSGFRLCKRFGVVEA